MGERLRSVERSVRYLTAAAVLAIGAVACTSGSEANDAPSDDESSSQTGVATGSFELVNGDGKPFTLKKNEYGEPWVQDRYTGTYNNMHVVCAPRWLFAFTDGSVKPNRATIPVIKGSNRIEDYRNNVTYYCIPEDVAAFYPPSGEDDLTTFCLTDDTLKDPAECPAVLPEPVDVQNSPPGRSDL